MPTLQLDGPKDGNLNWRNLRQFYLQLSPLFYSIGSASNSAELAAALVGGSTFALTSLSPSAIIPTAMPTLQLDGPKDGNLNWRNLV